MAKDDSRDVFEKALDDLGPAFVNAAGVALGARVLTKLARRVGGVKKPTRAQARSDSGAAWDRKAIKSGENIATAAGFTTPLAAAIGAREHSRAKRRKK